MATRRSPGPCGHTLSLPFETATGDDRHPTVRPLPIEPLTVRIPVAVRLTGIGRSKLYELIKAGEVETLKIGGSTLIPYGSLVRLIDRARERQR